jgi:beta-1,4-mannosyl-glycoprotein beta-1,4-N-acetylglucosaminyltransferase
MIYDCFTFFNELELLEIRLHELDPWVDRFVLVESPETFSGNSKPLTFKENKHLFKPFLPKIIHLVSPPAENPKNAWDRQINQRDYAMCVLSDCMDDDLILVSDVDEIINGRDFVQTQGNSDLMTMFIQKNYIYYMNLLRPGGWPGAVLLPYKILKSVYAGSLFKARMRRRKGRAITGGWHFSNLGGLERVILKMKSSGHFDSKGTRMFLANTKKLQDIIEVTRAVKGRKLLLVPTDDYPVWFRENIEKFKHLLTKEK